MKTESNTTPPAQPRPHATSRDLRWMALASAGGAGFTTAGLADAGLVQITQTNNFLTSSQNSITFDLTGDATDDLVDWQIYQRSDQARRAGLRGFLELVMTATDSMLVPRGYFDAQFNGNYNRGEARVRDTFVQSPLSRTSNNQSTLVASEVSASALIDISFTDSGINGGAQTIGLVQISSLVPSGGLLPRVTIDRLIFDDAQPDGSSLPSNAAVLAASYNEFGAAAVPEPSGVSIFALGAAGILAHRRRKRQAA